MAGRVVDLSVLGTVVPSLVSVDANVVANLLLASFFPAIQSASAHLDSQRAVAFFRDLQSAGGIGVVTPTAFVELVHVLIKGRYKHEINITPKLTMIHKYGKEYRNWEQLYKVDRVILQAFKPKLVAIKTILTVNGLMFVEPELHGPIPSSRVFDDEIIELSTRYGVDSSDARILLETQCCGLLDIVTFDKDMQHAAPDFNVYTWL